MDESLLAQLDFYLPQLDDLMQRGRELRDRLAGDSSSRETQDATRSWQEECAALVNKLSGLSKAHWLARAYSGAFLLRSPAGGVVEEVTVTEIVERILGVLGQAVASLSQIGDAVPDAAPRVRRFEFVHDAELRPVLEQAYADSRSAFEQGLFGQAFMMSCGVLEAVITDALEHAGPGTPNWRAAADGPVAGWSFEARIAAAERAGLIRGGCARLPPVARTYRNLADAGGALRADVTISEREARLAQQVLHVVMRDLDPGR